MREIDSKIIIDEVKKLCNQAAYQLPKKVMTKIKSAAADEKSPLGKKVLEKIIENDLISSKGKLPMCQDTGIVVCFVEIGNEVYIKENINDLINEGIRQGYKESFLRYSVVNHPVERINTGDNTPAIIYIDIVPGDKLKIEMGPKGGGSEGMSVAKIFPPYIGIEGIKKFVLESVNNAGGRPCPPLILGVGIGGTIDKATQIAKHAIFREIDDVALNKIDAQLERELLVEINKLGIGPMGFGGTNTALAVKVNSFPCHLVNLPIAVVFQCHAARHSEVII